MIGLHAPTRPVATGALLLPRVNLLPPEIAAGRAFRKVQVALGAGVVATFGLVGVLYLAASSSQSQAAEELTSATALGSVLKAESVKYADVTRTYAQAAAAQAMLVQAMGTEVRYSQLLNDLSLRVPENVWLKTLTFSQATAGVAPLGATTPGIGTVAVTGMGFSHDDVAVWLESVAGQKAYSEADFASSTESLLGTRKVVTFSATANLTPDAYSGRYTKPNGG